MPNISPSPESLSSVNDVLYQLSSLRKVSKLKKKKYEFTDID